MSRLTALMIGAMLLAVSEPLPAQTGSLFGARGPTAQPSLGGVRTNTRLGTSTQGYVTRSPFGPPASGFGAAPLGAMGAMGGPAPFGNMGTGLGTGFVGQNFAPQGFVGARQAGQQTGAFGRTAGFGGFGTQGMGMGFGQNQFGAGNFRRNAFDRNRTSTFQNRNQNQNAQLNQQPQIVVRSQIAFTYPERPAGAVVNRLDARFERVARRGPEFGNVSFDLAPGGEVVLRGTVPTDHAREIAAALVRLEPGVRAVRNELIVVPAPGGP